MLLAGKKILIGVSGSIAAYKSILLVRLLVKAGAEVKVVMTPAAKDFVSPLVLSTLSKNEVLVDLSSENSWSNHVQLGRWADVMLIAPASCNTLAKMANGVCDNLLMAVYLSATCPIAVAPAMDEDMWHHPSTKRNLGLISSYNNKIISVEKGELASGLFGDGRMAEPETIINFLIENYFCSTALLNKRIIITAGPTYEAIDPVRFIGNHSSGKMGYALAEAFYLQGADVTIIAGPNNQTIKYPAIKIVNVISSDEMFEAVITRMNNADIAVMAAAVADYKPTIVADNKIKKKDANWQLELEKTKDILQFIGNIKQPSLFIAGFALETENEKANAILKLKNKKADCIILNSLSQDNSVFGSDKNKITIIDSSEVAHNFESKSKREVANDIVSFIISKITNEKK